MAMEVLKILPLPASATASVTTMRSLLKGLGVTTVVAIVAAPLLITSSVAAAPPPAARDAESADGVVEEVPPVPKFGVTVKPGGFVVKIGRPLSGSVSPITSYELFLDEERHMVLEAGGRRRMRVSGLANGTVHTVGLRAVNAVGPSPVQSTVVTTPDVPSKARQLRVLSGKRGGPLTVTLDCAAPLDNGGLAPSRFDAYRITAVQRLKGRPKRPKIIYTPAFHLPIEITMPTRGPWVFKVVSKNAVGFGPAIKSRRTFAR